MEYKVLIGGTEYLKKDIKSATIKQPLFDRLSVGNACSAELDITVWPLGTIPRAAEIVPYARKTSTDKWEKLGVFYLDTRSAEDGALHIIAYDAMAMGDKDWSPNQSLEFPMAMDKAVKELAKVMGVTVDGRTVVNSSYTIDYPANDYTARDVLCYIAAANAGNWIITANGQLLLVPLFDSVPAETFRLVNEEGNAITFGGTVIVV